MGTYSETYIGVYLEVKKEAKTVEKTVYACPTHGVSTLSWGFCPQCGTPLSQKTTQQSRITYPDIWRTDRVAEILAIVHDDLNTFILLPNRLSDAFMSLRVQNAGALEIVPREEDKTRFESWFLALLPELQNVEYTVKWGVVSYVC